MYIYLGIMPFESDNTAIFLYRLNRIYVQIPR